MITQKQIDARDKLISTINIQRAMSERMRQDQETLECWEYDRDEAFMAIADADKEAEEMKDEMLDALIELYHEHAAIECNSCSVDNRPNSCVVTCRCIYENTRHVIERATGITIDEAIKAWGARSEK